MSAITSADERHQAQVAPITKGSRKVSQAENAVPTTAMAQAAVQALRRRGSAPHVAAAHAPRSARYPTSPSTPIGITPKSLAHALC